MPISNQELAQDIADLVLFYQTREEEFKAWSGGEVGGGPNSDGRYPLTDLAGVTTLVRCPAQMESDAGINAVLGSSLTATGLFVESVAPRLYLDDTSTANSRSIIDYDGARIAYRADVNGVMGGGAHQQWEIAGVELMDLTQGRLRVKTPILLDDELGPSAALADLNSLAPPANRLVPISTVFQASNRPGGGNYHAGWHFRTGAGSDYSTQMVFASTAGEPSMWLRSSVEGAWGGWRQVFHEGHLPHINEVTPGIAASGLFTFSGGYASALRVNRVNPGSSVIRFDVDFAARGYLGFDAAGRFVAIDDGGSPFFGVNDSGELTDGTVPADHVTAGTFATGDFTFDGIVTADSLDVDAGADPGIDTYRMGTHWFGYVGTSDTGDQPNNYAFVANWGSGSRGLQLASLFGSGTGYYVRRGSDNAGAPNGANSWQPWERLVTSDGNVTIDGAMTFGSNVTLTGGALRMDNGGDILTDRIGAESGQQLAIGAGESLAQMGTGNIGTGETLWLGADGIVRVVTSSDNWATGWAGRHQATLLDTLGNTYFPGNVQIDGEIRVPNPASDILETDGHGFRFGRHLDATKDWSGKGTTMFLGWSTDHYILGPSSVSSSDLDGYVGVIKGPVRFRGAADFRDGRVSVVGQEVLIENGDGSDTWFNYQNTSVNYIRGDWTRFDNRIEIDDADPDAINFRASTTNDNRGVSFNGRVALTADSSDGWLRLNNASQFTNGVYTPGIIRADDGFTITDNALRLTTGNYGTFSIVGEHVGGYCGLSLAHRLNFMENGSGTGGIYWDTGNEWAVRFNENGAFIAYYNGVEKFSTLTGGVSVTGSLTATGNVTAYSDARLKDDVESLDPMAALEMRGVSFTKDGKRGSGVIAQEVQAVAPELVQENEGGYLSVAYGNLVGYLIETVKMLEARISNLEAQVR